jgi:DNA-binding LytR/AlgR family response regulator
MIKAIAIDDEPPALKVVENFCKRVDFIDLQATFTKPKDALEYLEKNPVDLLFLDIQMPSLSGIDLYRSVKNTMVIFATAYSEFAVEGFNLNAIDYLLKPFTFERFTQAAEKAKKEQKLARSEWAQQHLFIRADYSLVKIELSDILYIEGLDDYLKIHLASRKPVVARITMKNILELLPGDGFARVHRSFIVPLSRIKAVKNKSILLPETEIPVGNSYEEQFMEALKKLNKFS